MHCGFQPSAAPSEGVESLPESRALATFARPEGPFMVMATSTLGPLLERRWWDNLLCNCGQRFALACLRLAARRHDGAPRARSPRRLASPVGEEEQQQQRLQEQAGDVAATASSGHPALRPPGLAWVASLLLHTTLAPLSAAPLRAAPLQECLGAFSGPRGLSCLRLRLRNHHHLLIIITIIVLVLVIILSSSSSSSSRSPFATGSSGGA